MRTLIVAAALLGGAAAAAAQQPPVPRTREDSIRAQAVADSIALLRELEALQDSAAARTPTGPGPGASRLLPDVSVVGDLVADLSPDGSTVESGGRLTVREVEVALAAAVDPYFRGEVYLGFSDEEVHVEQANITTTSLPWSLQLRLGRFLLPFGKQNTTHRHDLHSIEYPHVLQRFLGEEGLKGTGIEVSRIGAPFGFFQELLVTAVNDLGSQAQAHGEGDELNPASPASDELSGLGYSVRLRNYWDLGAAANVELSFSGATGKQPVALDRTVDDVNAVNARRTLVGADLTFRWRPLQQGLYRSFILQAEILRQLHERNPEIAPSLGGAELAERPRDYSGTYLFARWQLTRRTYLGGRFDWLEDPELEIDGEHGGTVRAASLYLEFFPSEFSKLNAGFERLLPEASDAVNRFLVQATFALGPHRPHPF